MEEDNDPAQFNTWLSTIQSLSYPNGTTTFTADDFEAMKTELMGELTAEAKLANFQNAQAGLFTDATLVNGTFITAIQDQVESDLQIDLTRNTAPPGWLSIFQDVMSIAGPIVGGVANASGGPPSGIVASSGIAMLDFIVNQSAEPTNNTSGTPLQATEQVEQAASMLASAAVNNYLQDLAGLGKMVNRIAGDPNRLNHFFAAQQLLAAAGADPTSSDVLGEALDEIAIAYKRQIYTKLIASSYNILQFQYSSPDSNINDAKSVYNYNNYSRYAAACAVTGTVGNYPYATAFFPGSLIDGTASSLGPPVTRKDLYPHDLWWDFWGIGLSGLSTDCPNSGDYSNVNQNFSKYGLFAPLVQGEQGSIIALNSPLGLYRTYFLNPNRSGISLVQGNNNDPYWSCYYCGPYDMPVVVPPHIYPMNPDNTW